MMAKSSTQPPPPKTTIDHIGYLSTKLAGARAELRGYEQNLVRIDARLLALTSDVSKLEVTVGAIASALGVIKWLVGISAASILAALGWAFLTLSQNTITLRRLDSQFEYHSQQARGDDSAEQIQNLFEQNRKLGERIHELENPAPRRNRRR